MNTFYWHWYHRLPVWSKSSERASGLSPTRMFLSCQCDNRSRSSCRSVSLTNEERVHARSQPFERYLALDLASRSYRSM